MKKVLVTGANGFLGRRFCQVLRKRGYSVKALVRKKEAACELGGTVEAEVIPEPWRVKQLGSALKGIDTVIHSAGLAHLGGNAEADYRLFRDANVNTTRALLEAASDAGVNKFLFTSSVLAMGSASEHVLSERSLCRPVTPYGRSKLEAEEVIRRSAGSSKVQHVILRLPLVYGPGNKANMLKLFKLVKKSLPIPLGAVSNRRSLIYIDNAIESALAVLESPLVKNDTFLVSDGQDVSVPELIKAIARALGRPCRLVPVPPVLLRTAGKVGDRIERMLNRDLGIGTRTLERLLGSLAVDSGKIRRATGWMPGYSLEEGLKITGEWFLENGGVKQC